MATKSNRQRKVGPHDVRKPPLPKPIPPGASHERPVSEGVELQAQRLVHKAGSADEAKKAIDAALERESAGSFRQDTFASRFGFASRAEMLAASQPLFDTEDSNWWATELANGRWVVWGQDDLSANSTFESLEAAREAVGDVTEE